MNFGQARDIETLAFEGPVFSVCTLVTDDLDYERMLTSFSTHGFSTENSEFILVDNRNGNRFDAFRGLDAMLARARGRYVICCHQDIELIGDGADTLLARLESLTALDPSWAVAGNAGVGPNGRAARISDSYGDDQHIGTLPAPVHSLDENFIVVRRDCRVGFSADLGGFHLYGTDLCIQAELRGLSAYVIDFHLRHYSRGNADETYFECARQLEDKYGRAFRSRRILTSFKPLYLTGNWWRAQSWRLKKWRRMRQLRLSRKRSPSLRMDADQ